MNDAPVTRGETHVLEIVELGAEGSGVGYVDELAILVDDATLGETVRVEITDVAPTYARADVVDAEFGFD